MSERQASNYRKGDFTNSHLTVLQILSENHVKYKAEEYVPVFGHFDDEGRPVVYRVDVLINDANFGAGVIEVDGLIHHTEKQIKKDAKKDIYLTAMGLWVERVPNDSAHYVMKALEKHRVKIDAYGGRS